LPSVDENYNIWGFFEARGALRFFSALATKKCPPNHKG
jgi:hypothetical protein